MGNGGRTLWELHFPRPNCITTPKRHQPNESLNVFSSNSLTSAVKRQENFHELLLTLLGFCVIHIWIWIDVLCILHSSYRDWIWTTHSSMVVGSTCTIVAHLAHWHTRWFRSLFKSFQVNVTLLNSIRFPVFISSVRLSTFLHRCIWQENPASLGSCAQHFKVIHWFEFFGL